MKNVKEPKTSKPKTSQRASKPADPEVKPSAEPKTDEPKPGAKPDPEPKEDPKPKPQVSGPNGEFGVPSDEPVLKRGEPGIRLKNLRNKAVGITLEHEVYCAAIGRCVCSARDVMRERRIERKSTAMAYRVETIRIPKSINLAPMGVSEPLHEAVKNCADVRPKLINRPQKLKVVPAA